MYSDESLLYAARKYHLRKKNTILLRERLVSANGFTFQPESSSFEQEVKISPNNLRDMVVVTTPGTNEVVITLLAVNGQLKYITLADV